MPIVKANQLAYCRVRVPDIAKAKGFFERFGLTLVDENERGLYYRGIGPDYPIHIVEEGPQRLASFAFLVGSLADLDRLSRESFASPVRERDEPGGGSVVEVRDPDGNIVEVVFGLESADAQPHQRSPMNSGENRLNRVGQLMRLSGGASHVQRLGHLVMTTPDPLATMKWYQEVFGLLVSDEVYSERDEQGQCRDLAAIFSRLDCGDDYVDHHVFQWARGPAGGVHHISFEVQDVDDLHLGHEHLRGHGYHHMWGIGRHTLGSQIFDYWLDPFGVMYEHWTDTDMLNATSMSEQYSFVEIDGPWGPVPLPSFFTHVS